MGYLVMPSPKPCPHCGKDPVHQKNRWAGHSKLVCKNCGVSGPCVPVMDYVAALRLWGETFGYREPLPAPRGGSAVSRIDANKA